MHFVFVGDVFDILQARNVNSQQHLIQHIFQLLSLLLGLLLLLLLCQKIIMYNLHVFVYGINIAQLYCMSTCI